MVKGIIQVTIIALSVIMLVACSPPRGGTVLSEEELFAILNRDFPGREFEILNIRGPNWGPGIDGLRDRHYTLRCLYSGIEFRTTGIDWDNRQYLNALWGRLTYNWRQEFQEGFDYVVNDFNPTNTHFRFIIGSEFDEWSNPILTPTDFTLITTANIAEPSLEEILKTFVYFERPIYIRLELSYRAADTYEFEKEIALENMRKILSQFVEPIYQRIYAEVGSDFSIMFMATSDQRVVSRDPEIRGWQPIQFRVRKNYPHELREMLESLDDYDFTANFSGLYVD